MTQAPQPSKEAKTSFFTLNRQRLQSWLSSCGLPSVHSDHLLRQVYKEKNLSPWLKEGLPLKLAPLMKEAFQFCLPAISRAEISRYDGSVKFLLKLDDGLEVEAVLMPEESRLTLCLSSQVGCAQGCVFCHTGRMGLTRNLQTHEIVGQVLVANQWLAENSRWLDAAKLPKKQSVSNVVFMGMGEPLDNVEAVIEAVEVFCEPLGLNIAPRKVTVSTAGHLPGLRAYVERGPKTAIALSLHSPWNAKRSKIMPINRKWSLEEILSYLRQSLPCRHVLIQYTLIAGVNDHQRDAEKLADLVEGLKVKVNLIPLNGIQPSQLASPEYDVIKEFQNHLHRLGLRSMIRYSKGQDIYAACGQLVSVNSEAISVRSQ